jgi:RND family efflux transporter MFP subunit
LPRRKNSSAGKWLSYGVVVAGVGAAVWFGGPSAYRWIVPAKDNQEVLTAPVQRGDMEVPVTDRGELEAVNSIQVNCDLEGGGKLVSIVPEGTHVKKGDEVGRIDTDALLKLKSEQEVKVEQAEGKLKAAKSDLDVQINKGETEVANAQLALELANIDFETYLTGKFKVDYETKKGLLDKSKKELKESEDNLEYAKNLVRKGQGQMEQVRQKELEVFSMKTNTLAQEATLALLVNVTKRRDLLELEAKASNAKRDRVRAQKSADAANEKARGDLRAAESTLAIEKTTLKRISDQVGRCVIKAPQDGIVIYSNSRPWDDSYRIQPGTTLFYRQQIFSRPDLAHMRVKLKVHESVVKRVVKDLPARMTIEALPGRILHGKVMSVGSVASQDGWRGGAVKEYEVIASIDDLPADAGLKPGMTAEVKIVLRNLSNVLLVPLQTVSEFGGKNVAYVVKGSDIERREVEIGERNDTMVQILGGVGEGELLALDARTRAAADTKAAEKTPEVRKKDPVSKPSLPLAEGQPTAASSGGS